MILIGQVFLMKGWADLIGQILLLQGLVESDQLKNNLNVDTFSFSFVESECQSNCVKIVI